MPNTPSMPANSALAPGLRKILSRACKNRGRRPQLADATLRTYAYKLDTELDELMCITPAINCKA
jgi:hypothetical protein